VTLEQLGIIIALGVSVGTPLLQYLNGRRAAKVAEDTSAVDGYSRLCESLQKQIDINNEQIVALRTELAEIRADRDKLLQRISDLETENAELRRRIDALQEPARGDC
jgi:predicted  nucleic acid-binding Zn-ribbon protein